MALSSGNAPLRSNNLLAQLSPWEDDSAGMHDMLVKRVGHEPENATAEVRRSFNGTYSPLYQAAYLLGGRQFYALHREVWTQAGCPTVPFI